MLRKASCLTSSILLAVFFLVFCSPLPALADAKTTANTAQLKEYIAAETTANTAQLKKYIAASMLNRETAFTIRYTGEIDQVKYNLTDIFLQAAGTDDYLSLAWHKMSYNYKIIQPDKLDIKFTIDYHTTKEEEEFIDLTVKDLINNLISPEMSDLTKETAIHNWIINNVNYDYTLQQKTAYTALTTKKTTCMGYSMLMKKMLNQAGVDAKIVTGHYPAGYHAWNMVKIDSVWYYVDITNDWAYGSTVPQNKTEAKMLKENYVWDKTKLFNSTLSNQVNAA